MKLEAVDKKNPDLTCVASINNVVGDYFLVHFDEWDDTYDYWCTETCPYLHPTGWCKENGIRLTPPQGNRCILFPNTVCENLLQVSAFSVLCNTSVFPLVLLLL